MRACVNIFFNVHYNILKCDDYFNVSFALMMICSTTQYGNRHHFDILRHKL